jgi:hypothetical protein
MLEKEAKSGIIQHKMVSHLRLFIRPQPEKDLQLRQTQIAPTLSEIGVL